MEFISNKEKRILLSAIVREKKIIEKNQYNDLIPVIEHLEYLFRYDRLFKKIYNLAIDDFKHKIELKYIGVHPDELYEKYYPREIVKTINEIAEQNEIW